MDALADGALERRARRTGGQPGLGDDHHRFLAVQLGAEDHRPALAHPRHLHHLVLDVLREIVLAVADEQILAASGDVELTGGEVAEIAGAQPVVA